MAHGHPYADGRVDDGRGLSVPVVCVKLGAGSALARRLPQMETVALAMFSMAFARPQVEHALGAAFPGRGLRLLTSPDSAVRALRAQLMGGA